MKPFGSGNRRRFVQIAAWLISMAGIVISLTWNGAIEGRAFALLKENAAAEASLLSFNAECRTTEVERDANGIKPDQRTYFLSTMRPYESDGQIQSETWQLSSDARGHLKKKTRTAIEKAEVGWAVSWFHPGPNSTYIDLSDMSHLPRGAIAWLVNHIFCGHSRNLASLRLLGAKQSVNGIACDVVAYRWEEYYGPDFTGIYEGRLYIGPDKLVHRAVFTQFDIDSDDIGTAAETQAHRTTTDTEITVSNIDTYPSPN